MRIGSLFAGIGGFDLAARWMGWETAWFSEIDPYASAVLAKHWPDVPNHGDITAIDFTTVEPVDLLCGGFPCQDISNAGKRVGITGERSGLWSEYARAIGELRPCYVVVENVAALLGRGLDRVLGDLAALGYDAEWEVLSAADVGAPHLRERVWIVAYPCGFSAQSLGGLGQLAGAARPHERASGQRERLRDAPDSGGEAVAHAECTERWPCATTGHQPDRNDTRRQEAAGGFGECRATLADADGARLSHRGKGDEGGECGTGGNAADCGDPQGRAGDVPDAAGLLGDGGDDHAGCGSESGQPIPESGDGRRTKRFNGSWWATEPDVGRVAHGVPARVDRLTCLGNAIVPQCALVIFRAIQEAESMTVPQPDTQPRKKKRHA